MHIIIEHDINRKDVWEAFRGFIDGCGVTYHIKICLLEAMGVL